MKKSEQFLKQISHAEAEVASFAAARAKAEDDRRAALVSGNTSKVIEAETAISAARRGAEIVTERIAVLREELAATLAEEKENVASDEQARLLAVGEAAHAAATEILKRLEKRQRENMKDLAAYSVLRVSIQRINKKLNDEQIADPEEMRREPVRIIPAHEISQIVREAGVYDARGNNLDLQAPPPRAVKRLIAEQRVGGTRPTPLEDATVLPPFFGAAQAGAVVKKIRSTLGE